MDELIQVRNDFVSLTEIKTDHPIFEIFRQSGRLSSTRFFSYFRSTPREQSSVLARFADGAPALVESAHGKGKLLFFARDGSLLGRDERAFVPLEHALLEPERWAEIDAQAFEAPLAVETPSVWLEPLGVRPLKGVEPAS